LHCQIMQNWATLLTSCTTAQPVNQQLACYHEDLLQAHNPR
jgi:hypothetical protein